MVRYETWHTDTDHGHGHEALSGDEDLSPKSPGHFGSVGAKGRRCSPSKNGKGRYP
jgi:hypothetical protein